MKDFKKYYTIPAPPEEVYLALTIPLSIKLWSGAEAEMSTIPNSDFSLFDGDIVGKNLAFEENKKIVQQWYFDGQKEESIVTMKIHEHKKGTSIELSHTNIPDDVYEEFVDGAKEGFQVAIRVIPFLVAILVAAVLVMLFLIGFSTYALFGQYAEIERFMTALTKVRKLLG